jgi:hypothetical protein
MKKHWFDDLTVISKCANVAAYAYCCIRAGPTGGPALFFDIAGAVPRSYAA